MIKNKDNRSLKLAIFSIVTSVFPWVAFIINSQITRILSAQFRVPDTVQMLMILIPFLFTYVGFVLAVQAKKNNSRNKMIVACLSVVSVIVASINTFCIFPVVATMFMLFIAQKIIIELLAVSIVLALTNSIFFIVIYALTKQKV